MVGPSGYVCPPRGQGRGPVSSRPLNSGLIRCTLREDGHRRARDCKWLKHLLLPHGDRCLIAGVASDVGPASAGDAGDARGIGKNGRARWARWIRSFGSAASTPSGPGGKGGQHQNATDSGVRLTHIPTGIVVTVRESRSQHRNKAIALERLRARLAALAAKKPVRRPDAGAGQGEGGAASGETQTLGEKIAPSSARSGRLASAPTAWPAPRAAP